MGYPPTLVQVQQKGKQQQKSKDKDDANTRRGTQPEKKIRCHLEAKKSNREEAAGE